jgi:hypothetical protein
MGGWATQVYTAFGPSKSVTAMKRTFAFTFSPLRKRKETLLFAGKGRVWAVLQIN